MDLKETQADRGTALSLIENLRRLVANFKIFFKEFEDFKNEVVADTQRKAALEAYFDNCECTMSWDELVSTYQKFKAISDAIEGT